MTIRAKKPKVKRTRTLLVVFGAIFSMIWCFTLFKTPIAEAAPKTAFNYDWLQFGFDSQHSGTNTLETIITPNNVRNLHRLFRVTLPAIADGTPVYLTGVSTLSGVRDLLFLTTRAGDIVALDAHMGAQIWIAHNSAGTCTVNNNGSTPCYTTSSPAIDPNRQYVYSYGLDGKVHKYSIGNGVETLTASWPQTATLKPWDEKGSSALAIATSGNGTSYLYVTHAGYPDPPGDQGDYQGHITAINLTDGSQHVFNALCSDQAVHFASPSPGCVEVQSGIWARPGVVYDPDTGKIYMSTGDGTFDPDNHHWADSVFALNPDGTGTGGDPLDSYTPTNHVFLNDFDIDLGSTAPAILPTPITSTIQHLALQGGKDSVLRLLNLDNLNGNSEPGITGGEVFTMTLPQGGTIKTQPAVWVNPADNSTWAFITNYNGIAGIKLVMDGGGNPSLSQMWQNLSQCSAPPFSGCTSPIVANGILFFAVNNNIFALNPINGSQIWHDTSIGSIHWESPIVANGILYITDGNSQLTAYVPNVSFFPLIFR